MGDGPRILIVDDDAANTRMVVETLDADGYCVETASDGVEALDKVRASPPDLLILDAMPPSMSGMEVCRIVKSQTPDSFIPIIVVTAKGNTDSSITGLRIGADDYLTKPYNVLELRARVGSMLRVKALQDELANKRRQLDMLTSIDDLTGLLNHHAVQYRLRDEFQRAQRYNDPLSVVAVDVDHFKQVNERYGHQHGDRILAQLGKTLARSVRDIDVVAHCGGDEFLAILPQTHFAGASKAAERMWRAVGQIDLKARDHALRLSLSVGISAFPCLNTSSAEDLLARAEDALRCAKQKGRNCIYLHQHVSYVLQPSELGAS